MKPFRKYLCDESIDKKKQEFNLQGWTTVVVKVSIVKLISPDSCLLHVR